MAVSSGNLQSIGTHGWWRDTEAAGSTPGAPSISSLTDNGDGSVTVAVDGDAGVTNYLYYMAAGDGALTQGESRSGDGDITQTGLTTGQSYWFVVVSQSGSFYSPPSAPILRYVSAATTTHTYEILHVRDLDERGIWQELLCTEVESGTS